MGLNKGRQPEGLLICSVFELWERLGFYVVQSSLVIFLVNQLKFNDIKAYSLYAAFTGLLYAGPVLGGFLADNFLNLNRSIFLGIIFYIAGYLALSFHSGFVFYVAFGLLIAGNSFVKSNISTLVGALYQDNDLRRDAGFTLFYFGMNIGQVIGPLAAAFAIKYSGFSSAFLIAALSLVFSLISFAYGQRYFTPEKLSEDVVSCSASKQQRNIIYACSVVVVFALAILLPYSHALNIGMIALSVLALVYLLYCGMKIPLAEDRFRLFSLIILFVFSAIYWGIWMQVFTSLTLFAERNVHRVFLGFKMPVEVLASIESVGIILFAPLLAKIWLSLGNSRWQPGFAMKFAYGFLFCAFAFALLVLALAFSPSGAIALFWLVASMFLMAISELCLSAIGLSAVTVLSPKSMRSTMMGFWFVTIAAGLMIANKLADMSVISKHAGAHASALAYTAAFTDYAVLSFVMFVVLLCLSPVINGFFGVKGFLKV